MQTSFFLTQREKKTHKSRMPYISHQDVLNRRLIHPHGRNVFNCTADFALRTVTDWHVGCSVPCYYFNKCCLTQCSPNHDLNSICLWYHYLSYHWQFNILNLGEDGITAEFTKPPFFYNRQWIRIKETIFCRRYFKCIFVKKCYFDFDRIKVSNLQ